VCVKKLNAISQEHQRTGGARQAAEGPKDEGQSGVWPQNMQSAI